MTNGWIDQKMGLLGPALNSPLFSIGTGLLAASGPSATPISRGQRIAQAATYATAAQRAAAENDLYRERLLQSQQEREGIAKIQEFVAANPDATDADLMRVATQYMPEVAIKARLGNVLSPTDQASLLNTQATLLKLQQEVGFGAAETTTPAGSVVRSVGTLADTFDAVEKEGNPFAPGGMFYKEAPLGKLGVTADAVLGLPDVMLRQYGDPAQIRAQAQQAQLIDKETATISRGLQQLGQKGSGRSATAIEQMQVSLGEGNIGISVRRKVISSTLETVIDDLESKGLEVPQPWYDLRDRLVEQTKNVGKASTKGKGPEVPRTADKVVGAISGALGMDDAEAVLPTNMLPNTSTTITPDPGVPFRVSPPTATPPGVATPPAAAPVPKGVKTSQFGINPLTGQPAPKYNRPADAERALPELKKKGITHVIVVDPKTGVEYLYGVE